MNISIQAYFPRSLCNIASVLRFTTAVTLSFSMLSMPSASAVTQCGSFEMVDIPGRISLMTAFADGTATGIGYSSDNSGTQVIRYFDGLNWTEHSMPSEADGFIFGSSGSSSRYLTYSSMG